ncbi:ER membrane protein complex subunit 2 isoform X2 [Lepeophtheirus salmonis]|uniref:ER membrane protein complex subunit 2 isoform X2 n=1 Tax=Lepeophtheirus salmonis TaxID=72036 RepID=UPI003AF3C86E
MKEQNVIYHLCISISFNILIDALLLLMVLINYNIITMKNNKISLEEARDLLRYFREKNDRKSEEIIDIWDNLSDDNINKIGDECWIIYEQVALASLDCQRFDIFNKCLSQLKEKFELDSQRVARLYAMYFEVSESEDGLSMANNVLDKIPDVDDANSQVKKRKIAILKAQGETSKAISELNKFLKDYMHDQESWMELCDLYIQDQDYVKAAFCCEELFLHNPHNHIFYQRFAEIKYTQGGFENLETAKYYYCHALQLNPNNTRALYGLLLTCSQVISSPKCTALKKKDYLKIITWGKIELTKMYEEKVPKISDTYLKSLSVHIAST